MGGVNPYIEKAEFELPTKPYRVRFLLGENGEEELVEVDPAKLPYDRSGLPGSILDIALGHGIEIESTCGGVCACSTCHVILREGYEACNEANDDELDRVEDAPGNTLKSRLGCQCVPDGSSDVVVEIPGWNRNAVKEEHHH